VSSLGRTEEAALEWALAHPEERRADDYGNLQVLYRRWFLSLNEAQRVNDRYKELTGQAPALSAAKAAARVGWQRKWYQIGDQCIFLRSLWEFNYAQILENRKRLGIIRNWRYEPITFWFLQIKRGTRSYKPDFEVTLLDGSIEYHEVKGWMTPRSRTALKRMAKYHPDVVIRLIGPEEYRTLRRGGV
jgi:hypothetical protein